MSGDLFLTNPKICPECEKPIKKGNKYWWKGRWICEDCIYNHIEQRRIERGY